MSEKRDRRGYMKAYREKNYEKVCAYNRQFYWEHREARLAYQKAYRERKKAEMTEKDLEERREYQRVMYQIYKEQRHERKLRRLSGQADGDRKILH